MLKRQLAFPFWKQKLRLELTLSVQNGIRKIPGEKGEADSALATPSITAIDHIVHWLRPPTENETAHSKKTADMLRAEEADQRRRFEMIVRIEMK